MTEKIFKSDGKVEKPVTSESKTTTSTMFAIPVSQDTFDQVFENLPKEYHIESVLQNKKKFPHITICRPVKDTSIMHNFSDHPNFQKFVQYIFATNKGMLHSDDVYCIYDPVSNSTHVCLRFVFGESFGEKNLTGRFLEMREGVYTDVGIDTTHRAIPLHLTLAEVPGKLELPSLALVNNFSHSTSFSPRVCQKVEGSWAVTE